MRGQRRHSKPIAPAQRQWTVPRRLALPPAANDNRMPAARVLLRAAAFAALAACAWLVALAT